MYSFPNLEPVHCSMSTSVASWPIYKFLRRQVRWSGIPMSLRIFQFVVIHTVKGFSLVNKTEVDVFLELSWFFYDPMDVGSLISGSSAFSKFSLNIWRSLFMYWGWLGEFWGLLCWYVRCVQLCGSLNILWHCLSLRLEWKLNFSSPVAMLNFPNLLTGWVQHCNSIIF